MDDQQNEINEKPNVPTPLQSILIIIASIFLSFILMEIILFPFVPKDPSLIHTSSWVKLVLVLGESGLIVLPLIYLKRKNFPIREILRWNPIDKRFVVLIFAIGLSMSIVGDEIDRLVSLIFPQPEFLKELEAMLKINSVMDFFLLVSGAVIVASIAEETVFRGLFQVSLEKHQNVNKAVIYSSLLWAVIHGLHWAVPIFLMGIILGYLSWRTKSIIPSAICHGINNGLALLFTNVEGGGLYAVYEWKGHVSPLILIPAIYVLVKGIQLLNRSYLTESSSSGMNGLE
jgi:membrane protease YdiL (CAAX protease family)